jgi:hypothetical protein
MYEVDTTTDIEDKMIRLLESINDGIEGAPEDN